MKKILEIVPSWVEGGTEMCVLEAVRHLTPGLFDVTILSLNDILSPEMCARAEEINARVDVTFIRLNPLEQAIEKITEFLLSTGPYAALHAHVETANALFAEAGRRAGIPVRISHAHMGGDAEPDDPDWAAVKKARHPYLLSAPTILAACSAKAGAHLYGAEVFAQRGLVCPLSVESRWFATAPAAQTEQLVAEYGLAGQTVFTNITRFDLYKNALFTQRIFAEILKLHPDSILVLGGTDGVLKQPAIKLAQELGIADRVRFLGVRSDIPAWLDLTDVYLLPSLSEGLPHVALEAQAKGVPVLTSTGVTTDTDMGVNLFERLSLEDSYTVWAERACHLAHDKTGRMSAEQRRLQFRQKGYLAEDVGKLYEALYLGQEVPHE